MSDYYDLGNYSRSISTKSPDAQLWFDRGLIWNYGYHHEEAIECFKKSLEYDPACVMAHWGIAYASGPNYNKQWGDFDDDEKQTCLKDAHEAVANANKNLGHANYLEIGLIEALEKRYPSDASIEDFGPWNDAFADAMRKVYQDHPEDMDICTIFAEAIMNRTPWKLWNLPTGKPAAGADTLEAIEVLETAFTRLADKGSNKHPGLLHMYLHLMEMSPHPEKALNAGDSLSELVPDAGHLLHMATHVDVLCGDYQNVVLRNHKAIQADKKYLARSGSMNFYTIYRCHNYHFKIYGAMFLGQMQVAVNTADELTASLTRDVLEPMADWLEPFYPMKQHVLIRFGKWDEIKAQALPEDSGFYVMTTALIHYAKTVACAATGDIPGAEAARSDFRAAKAAVPETRMLFNNTCADILGVAEAMLEGELSYRKGDFDEAFDHLRRSVALDDNLPYDEPWGWMQPTRHALGALLLEQDRIEEAEAIYRADLGFDDTLARACQHPNNVWSLHGMHECLSRLGREKEAMLLKPQLEIALARADVEIKYSCYCRGM
jgi:tetratricopeptide (TPR) repeat protein